MVNMRRIASVSKDCSQPNILDNLKEIKEKVLRILGKYQRNTLTIRSEDVLHNYISVCINNGIIAIDTETNNSLDPLTCKLMGLCLYTPGYQQVYVPINHRDPISKQRLTMQLTESHVKVELQRILDSGITIVMHNGKFDYEVLKCTCDICVKPHWDTMIAARLLNENESASLKNQYASKIDKSQESYKIDELFKKIQYADVDPEIFALYSATDAYITHKLYEYQLPLMDSEKKIYKLFKDIEMPLVTIVAEMELCGALADLSYCQKLQEKYEAKLIDIDQKLNDEILKIQPLIDTWKISSKGLERERFFLQKVR